MHVVVGSEFQLSSTSISIVCKSIMHGHHHNFTKTLKCFLLLLFSSLSSAALTLKESKLYYNNLGRMLLLIRLTKIIDHSKGLGNAIVQTNHDYIPLLLYFIEDKWESENDIYHKEQVESTIPIHFEIGNIILLEEVCIFWILGCLLCWRKKMLTWLLLYILSLICS